MRLSILLVFVVPCAFAEAPGEAALPVTIDERNAACIAAEDAEPERAIALAQSVLDRGAELGAMQRAEAISCRGWAQATVGRKEDARRDAQALRELLRALPPGAERIRMTRRTGGILHRSGDRVGAVDLYAQAVTEAESAGLEAERVPLLINLGVLHSEFEEHPRAQVNYEQALALMERLGDRRYEAPVRYNLGLTLAGQDRDAEAVPHLRRALELITGSGAGGPMQELGATLALANALQASGQTGEASALIERARAIEVPTRDPSVELQLTMAEARQQAEAGDLVGALATVDAIDTNRLSEIQQWSRLERRANLLEQLGRHQEATVVLREINRLRETYLRHQNHERLAALESHLRDREQRLELERLQADAEAQARRLETRERLQSATAVVAVALLVLGALVLLWQRRMNRRLYEASHTDPLTGLANRRRMTGHLRAAALDPLGRAAVVLIDIDLFKRINDDHGHEVGDQVLVAHAQRLREALGAEDEVARWGGEEFLVLLRHADAERTRALVERLRVRLAQPIATVKGELHAGASLGFANLPLPGVRHPDAWHYSIQLADSALYLAKRAGRDAWAGYWIEHAIPDWPPERLGREPHLARSLQLITPQSSRPLRDAVAPVASA